MSIAFLVDNELEVQGNGRCSKIDRNRNSTDAWPYLQVTSTFSAHDLASDDQSSRVGRWVASQSVTLPSDSDSGYAADSEESTLCGPEQRPRAHFNGQVDNAFLSNAFPSNAFPSNAFPSNVFPSHTITFAEQQTVDSELILLPEANLLRPGDFRPPSKRARSSRLAYTQEEKLFIMYARVLRKVEWIDISNTFEISFGYKNTSDTISGLRSIYYRTRREWGMDYVTRTGSAGVQSDIRIVSAKLHEHAELTALDRDRRKTSRLRLALDS
ncbi:hypothetical protein E2P81_ATG10300 [Venturia nashicola]|nr:hypothetical protein E2P81_ATG10300 [Venturia nashicola]